MYRTVVLTRCVAQVITAHRHLILFSFTPRDLLRSRLTSQKSKKATQEGRGAVEVLLLVRHESFGAGLSISSPWVEGSLLTAQ